MKFSTVIVGAGRGLRAGYNVNKIIKKICGTPLLYYTLEAFCNISGCIETILVVSSLDYNNPVLQKKMLSKYGVTKIVIGGERRSDSVAAGVFASDSSAEYVLIHDAARPFIKRNRIREVLSAAEKTGAAILAIPVSDTLKKGNE
ncbi:MAG: 2-C-methyl-D-erythritol 4-phosphate cytidylyltransferase, partial [Planctomycetota bacterium]